MSQRLFLHTDSLRVELRTLQFNLSGQLIYVEDLDFNRYYFEEPVDPFSVMGRLAQVRDLGI